MNFFWPGFLIFLLYTAACFMFSVFFFDTTKNHGVTEEVFTGDNKAVIEERLEEKPLIKNDTISNNELELENTHKSLTETDKGISEKTLNPIPDSRSIQIDPIATNYKAQPFDVYGSSNTIVIPCNLYFVIYKNGASVKIPFGHLHYNKEIKKLAAIDDKSILNINGYSSIEEDPSLGNEPAEYLRELLLEMGIDTTKIKTTDSFQNIEFVDSAAKGGVYMEVTRTTFLPLDTSSTAPTYSTRMEAMKSSPLFPFSCKKIISGYQGGYFCDDQAFTFYISKIKEYLQKNPSKNIEVYAHADSIGDALDHISIAEVNSWTVKRIITTSGIPNFSVKCI